jgi:hypothetical protein
MCSDVITSGVVLMIFIVPLNLAGAAGKSEPTKNAE